MSCQIICRAPGPAPDNAGGFPRALACHGLCTQCRSEQLLEPDSQALPWEGSQFWGMESGAGLWLFPGSLCGARTTHGAGGGWVWGDSRPPGRGTHTESTLCQEGSWVLGQVCDAVGREPFPGTPGSEPWPSSALLIPIGHTTNIPRNIPGQPSLPSTFQGLLSLLLALLLPHHLQVSCHIPGLSLPSSMSIITTASPSAHPHGISLLTTLPASLPGTQGHLGSPALSPCARAPGIAPNCSSQATDRHFWEESDLHNIPRQGSASLQEQQKDLGTPPCLAPMVVAQRTPVVLQE